MGARSHIQGAPQRPGLLRQSDLRAILARDAERTADNRPAIYVRPLGRGLHLVRNFCNEQPYIVGSISENLTYSPGTVVSLASNTGHPGETIQSGPPPGKKGGALVGQVTTVREARFGLTPNLAGRPHVGITSSAGSVYAHLYYGGTYDSEMAVAVNGVGTDALQSISILSTDPLVIAYWYFGGHHRTWNITTNTVSAAGGPYTNANFSRELCSSRNGYTHFYAYSHPDYYALHRIYIDNSHSKITPNGSEDPPVDPNGAPAGLLMCGETGIIPVDGDPVLADAGYIKVGAFTSELMIDTDWLPGDPTSDFVSWTPGHTIPGADDALCLHLSGRPLGRITASPAFTQVISSANFGSVTDSQLCDPSPDGSSALIYRFGSGPDKIAHVSLLTDEAISWDVVDNSPLASTPIAFFCLD